MAIGTLPTTSPANRRVRGRTPPLEPITFDVDSFIVGSSIVVKAICTAVEILKTDHLCPIRTDQGWRLQFKGKDGETITELNIGLPERFMEELKMETRRGIMCEEWVKVKMVFGKRETGGNTKIAYSQR